MLTVFSNIFKIINECRKICKIISMATQGSHYGALQNFPFFLYRHSCFICLYLHSKLFKHSETYVLERTYMYFDMYVKFDKFKKNDVENIEIYTQWGFFQIT